MEQIFKGGQRDRAYLPKLGELIGPHAVKVSLSQDGVEYFSAFAAKVKAADLDSVICTDAKLMEQILKALPDFKPSFNKNGSPKRLTLDNYHGSFVTLEGFRLGRDKPLEVLFLNPLEHLRTVPEAPYIFKRFITKITQPDKWFKQTTFTWEVAHADNVEYLYARFQHALLIGVDIETDKDSPHRTINCSGYCALFNDGTTHTVVIPITTFWGVEWMRKFNSLPAPKVLQNGLYDNLYYFRYASPIYNWTCDTNILFHCWYSELPKRLDYITAFAIREVRYWKDDGKSGGLQSHYEYNARDCWATLNTWISLLNECPDWARENYYQEFPLVFPCLHVEADGMQVDEAAFHKARQDVLDDLRVPEGKLEKWISPKFNARSPVQVKNLMKVMGCADKHGKVESSDEKSLLAASATHPLNAIIFNEILEVRGLRKLRDTYLVEDKFWNWRLFCKFNPAGTVTGRLACSESSFWTGISLQVIPVRDGPRIRQFIKADDGWLLGENDQPQAEARCVGYISGCTSLIELVEGPHDYHAWNAQAFFGVPYESIYSEELKKTLNKKLRDLSKRTNHGANYNMGAQVMLDTMGPLLVMEARTLLKLPSTMSLLSVCAFLLDAYAKTYPEVKVDLQDHIKRTIAITKKLVSPFGWTRQFFGNPMTNKPALNAAVAHGPQNLSVAIINRAFYKVWRESLYGSLVGKLRLKAQIHDSLLYCYKGSDVPQKVAELMTIPVEITDIKGVKRTMVIHPDISAGEGKTYWSQLK